MTVLGLEMKSAFVCAPVDHASAHLSEYLLDLFSSSSEAAVHEFKTKTGMPRSFRKSVSVPVNSRKIE